MSSSEHLVVIVLSYNGLADTRKCLTSLQPALRPFVTPLLVDNGSTDGTAAAVEVEFPWCRIVRVAENRGPVVGNNAGIQAARELHATHMVLLNNDTTVDPHLFDALRDAAVAHPEFSVLGPVIKFMDDPDVVMTDGTRFNPNLPQGFFQRLEVPLRNSAPPEVTDVDIVNGCCLMITAAMVEKIRGFDERIFMYHDELDLCLQVLAAGGRVGVIDHALIWHKGSATSIETGKRSTRYFDARNLLYVLRKHHGVPRHGRRRLKTTLVYFRYMFHWYCAEVEHGNALAATAVLDGISDGITRRDGPYKPASRMGTKILRFAFELGRRAPRRRPEPKERLT